jgi:hypothetical protein
MYVLIFPCVLHSFSHLNLLDIITLTILCKQNNYLAVSLCNCINYPCLTNLVPNSNFLIGCNVKALELNLGQTESKCYPG